MMGLKSIPIAAVLLIAASGRAAHAQASKPAKQANHRWEQLKEAPPSMVAMAAHGKTLIGADGGEKIYRSQDSGRHWTPSPVPDPKATVGALASCGSVFFAGAINEGRPDDVPLFISQDDGVTWKPTGLEGNRLKAVGCSGQQVVAGLFPRTAKEPSPSQPAIAYPAGSPAGVIPGIGETSRGGEQYRAVNLKGDVAGDVLDPMLVVSHDGGTTWELLRKQFDLLSVVVSGERIEVFGRDSSPPAGRSQFLLNYCTKTQDWVCAKIYSKYQGAFPTALQRLDRTLFVGTVLGTMMISRDEGAAWKETLLPLPSDTEPGKALPRLSGISHSVVAMTVVNHHVVAGTNEKGVYLNDADSWTMIGDRPLLRLRCLQFDGTYLYAGTLDGVYRVTMNGAER